MWSAPGKVFLFGEHAVVYGKPGIAFAIKPRVYVTVRKTSHAHHAKSPYIDQCFKEFGVKGSVYINSQLPSSSGLGSSAAVTVATLAAINDEFDLAKSKDEIAEIAYKIEKRVQKGRASPTDTTVSTYGGMFLIKDGSRKRLAPQHYHIVIGNSQVSHSTSRMVEKVADMKQKQPGVCNPVIDAIESLTLDAMKHLDEPCYLGKLMDINHSLLESLGVGHPALTRLVLASRITGAYGAKITGAGGGRMYGSPCSKESERKNCRCHRSIRGKGHHHQYGYRRAQKRERCLKERLLNLAGSVITDKSCVQNGMIRSDALRQVAAELKKYPDMPLIIVHGAGSCGHPQAKQYHLDVGVTRENRIGIFETHHAVKTLNEKVVEVLRESGIEAVSIHPFHGCLAKDGSLVEDTYRHLSLMLDLGLVPVIHGDVVMDSIRGACIVSGDQLIRILAEKLGMSRVGLATDVPGLLDRDGSVVRELSRRCASTIHIGSSGHVDVTGGMEGKIAELLCLADFGIRSDIFHISQLGLFLAGQNHGGTTVFPEKGC